MGRLAQVHEGSMSIESKRFGAISAVMVMLACGGQGGAGANVATGGAGDNGAAGTPGWPVAAAQQEAPARQAAPA